MASESNNSSVMVAGEIAYLRKIGTMVNRGTLNLPDALSSRSYEEGYIGPNSVLHGTDLADTNEYLQCETSMKSYLGESWQEVPNERTIITNSNVIKNMLLPGETNMQSLANSIVPDPTLDYTLLDWVETKGNNYINLGSTASIGTSVVGFDFDFMPLDNFEDITTDRFIFGKYYSSASRRYYYIGQTATNQDGLFYNYYDASTNDIHLIQGQRQQMSLHNNILTLPDGTTLTLSGVTTSSGRNYIGCCYPVTSSGYTKVRVYGVKIYNSDGTMLRNCIPVRNNLTGYAKIFDLVSNVYMYNTGTLHGGPVKEGGNS